MTAENFEVFMKHFVKSTRCSKEHRVLLIIVYIHDSYISVEMINFAKDNGVFLLTFTPHCSHRMQPLHRTVYGPFKHFCNDAAKAFMNSNPGKTIAIYDICELAENAFSVAFTPHNIISSFRVTYIYISF